MDKRVIFDFEIEFTNGGGIQGQDFRLDIESDTISDKELADYIVDDLRLLMVGKVNILNKFYIDEKHKRKTETVISSQKLIDLSHVIFDGLITYKGLPAPIICDYLSREKSRGNYEEGTEFQIGKIEMVTNTGTYIDCPFHRFEHGKDLSEVELESFANLEAVTVHVPETLEIGSEYFKNLEIIKEAVTATKKSANCIFQSQIFLIPPIRCKKRYISIKLPSLRPVIFILFPPDSILFMKQKREAWILPNLKTKPCCSKANLKMRFFYVIQW